MLYALTLALLIAAPEGDITPPASLMSQARAFADAAPFAVPAKDIARWTASSDSLELLLSESHLSYDTEGRVVRRSRLVYRLNDTASIQHLGTREFSWAAWHQSRPELKVRVVSPSGEETWLDPRTVSEQVGQVANLVIDDRRTLIAALPGLSVGALVEEVLVSADTRPVYPGAAPSGGHRFSADEYAPVIQRLSIEGPSAPKIATDKWTHPAPRVERRGDRHLVSVEVKRQGRSRPQAAIEWSFGGTWQSAADAYQALIAEAARVEAPAELVTKGLGVAGTMKKVVAKMRYTGLTLGDASVVPYPPTEVWKRGYGDCKDVSLLVVNALAAQGFEASLALLNVGDDQDILPEVVGLDRFNHAIVYVHPRGDTPAIWIDTTAPELAAGVLPDSALERWALLIHPRLGAQLVKTPDREAQADTVLIETRIEARPIGKAHVKEVVTWSGSIAGVHMKGVEAKTPATERLLWIGSRFSVEALDKASLTATDDRTVVATVELTAPTHVMSYEEGSFPLNQYAHLLEFMPDLEDYEGPLRLSRRQKLVHTTRVVAPPGFVVVADGISDNEVKVGPTTWRESYTREGDDFLARAELELGHLDWTAEEVATYSKALSSFHETRIPSVQVVSRSRHLANRGEFADAFEGLRTHLQTSPRDGEARARLALLAAEMGLGDIARQEITRALKDTPRSRLVEYGELFVSVVNPLGIEFGEGIDRAWALTTARKVLKANPKDFAARTTLAQILISGPTGAPRLGPEHAEGVEILKDLALEQETGVMVNWAAGAARESRWKDMKEVLPKLEGFEDKNTFLAAAIAGADGPEALRKALPTMTRDRVAQAELVSAAAGFLGLARDYESAHRIAEAFARDSSMIGMQAQVFKIAKKIPFQRDYSTPEAALGSMINAEIEGLGISNSDDDATMLFRAMGEEARAMTLDIAWSMSRRIVDGDDQKGWRIRMVVDGGQIPLDLTTWWIRRGDKLELAADRPGRALGIEALKLYQAGDIEGARRWFGWWLEHDARAGKSLWSTRWPDARTLSPSDIELGAATLALSEMESYAPAAAVLSKRIKELPRPMRMLVLKHVAETRGAKTPKAVRALWDEALAGDPPDDFDWITLSMLLDLANGGAEALALLEARIQETPQDVMLQSSRALMLGSMGRYDEAAAAYEALRQAGSLSTNDLNNAAWNDVMRGRIGDAGTLLTRSLGNTKGGKGSLGRATQHTLAMVELERGNIKEALAALRASVASARKLGQETLLIQARMADRLGFVDWARTTYEKLVRDDKLEFQSLVKRYLAALPAPRKK